MRLFTILKRIIQTMLSRKNLYYYRNNTVAATKSATFAVCTLTGLQKGIYLIVAGVDASTSSTSTLLADIVPVQQATRLAYKLAKTPMTNGGGCNCWALVEVTADGASVNLNSYGYHQEAWNCRGSIAAIRLIR